MIISYQRWTSNVQWFQMEPSYTSGFWKSHLTSAKHSITTNPASQPSPETNIIASQINIFPIQKKFWEGISITFPLLRSLASNLWRLLHFEEVSAGCSAPPPAVPRANPPSLRCSLCHRAAPLSATAVPKDLDHGSGYTLVRQGGWNTFDNEHMTTSNHLPTSSLLWIFTYCSEGGCSGPWFYSGLHVLMPPGRQMSTYSSFY